MSQSLARVAVHAIFSTKHREPLITPAARPDLFAYLAGALNAIRELGLQTPGDVQLAALTDSEYTRHSEPGITSLDLNLEKCAEIAVQLMTRRLEGQPPPEAPPTVAPTLKWRTSTRR